MPKLTYALIAVFSSVMFFSCSKDDAPQNTSSIQGTYKFISLETNITSSIQTGTEKAVTVTRYTTINNQGSVKFDASKATNINLYYTVDTVVKYYYYDNGVLEDSYDEPFTTTISNVNSSAPYKMVGADSIYFSSGTMFFNNIQNQQSMPSGAKITRTGNYLYLHMPLYKTSIENVQGHWATTIIQGWVKISLLKE